MRENIALAIASAFGLGFFPKAPGTAGAAGGIAALALGAAPLPGVALLLLPGVWAASVAAQRSGQKDPPFVVVDEVLGQWVTMIGSSAAPASLAAGFLLFRVFDIVKPWPVRAFERLPGGWGIVLDDLAAGAYGFLVMLLLRWGNLIN